MGERTRPARELRRPAAAPGKSSKAREPKQPRSGGFPPPTNPIRRQPDTSFTINPPPPPRAAKATRANRAAALLHRLPALYPDAHCELRFESPLQLLVATILSAQCTDVRVNLVTPTLFARCPTVADFAAIPPAEIEALVRTTGFFRNKAKNIRAAARQILDLHGGEVPRTLEELSALPGVGRKTANVVLGNAFALDAGIVVDTHVGRLANRLGLTTQTNPVKIEQDLIKLFPKDHWTILSHWLIAHGRARCKARNPDCKNCELNNHCPSKKRFLKS